MSKENDPLLPTTKEHAKYSVRETNGVVTEKRKRNNSSLEPTYRNLLKNRPFRLYLLSYLTTEMGVWFTYVASISIIEAIYPRSYIRITILVILRLIPNLLISAFGGVLADALDRRHSMIFLDMCGTFIALCYLLVLKFESIILLYVLTFTQQSIAALYEPVRNAIVPMLVTDDEFLSKANMLTGLSWSVMAAVGSALGGFATANLGPQGCFFVDSLTYATSAFLMWQVCGTWKVDSIFDENPKSKTKPSVWETLKTMIYDGLKYIKTSSFGLIVFMKASGAILWGAVDVLNVAFSKLEGNVHDSNERLGLLFACTGFGCAIGPLTVDYFTDVKKPESLQIACIASIGLMAFSAMGLGYSTSFYGISFFSVTRAMGSSILWIYSSLILQLFTDNDKLGRVTSIEFSLCMLAEALSALFAGVAQDDFHLSAHAISYILSVVGFSSLIMWCYFHCNGGGVVQDDGDSDSLVKQDTNGSTEEVTEDKNGNKMLEKKNYGEPKDRTHINGNRV